MASVTASCTRAQAGTQCSRPTRPLQTNMMAATAPNESQNPAESTAHGSISNTISKAAASTTEGASTTPIHRAHAITQSMYTVRCAGTAYPASRAYANAAARPATAAALG